MHADYEVWLYANFKAATARVKLSDLKRIEVAYGDLDLQFRDDEFKSIFEQLSYSAADQAAGKQNPSKVATSGGLYVNLGGLRHALKQYRIFLDTLDQSDIGVEAEASLNMPDSTEVLDLETQRIHLESDMQNALRREISQLEVGLEVVDGGSERRVASGRIDILARDRKGSLAVIELKAGRASRDAVAQILSYMGDLTEESEENSVRGILVAQEFDPRAIAAARVVPTLTLKTYGIRFYFANP